LTYPISRYLHVRAAYFPGFAPGGDTLFFLSDITGVPQVWQTPAEAGAHPWWPRQLTFGDDRVLGLWPSPAGPERLVYARDAGGNEMAQLFLLDPEQATEVPLTAGHENAMHLFGCWTHDGETVFFAANRRHPAHFEIYRQHVDGGEAQLVWEHHERGYLMNFSLTEDGRRLAFARHAASFEHDLFLLDVETERVRQLSPEERKACYEQVAFAPGGRTLYVITDLDSDFLHLRRLEPASGAWETLVAPNWDVELLALSQDGRYLAYTVNVEGESRLEVIDMRTGTGRPGPELRAMGGGAPGVVATSDAQLTFSPDGAQLAFSFTSAARTSDVFVWDVEEDEVHAATRAGHAGLPLESFVTPELVRYPTFDDRQIPAWYYRPPGKTELPVVVFVHGGPESQFQPTFNFLVQYLVQNGYAVLAPNVRGSTGYGNAYSHLDNVERRMDSVADLAHAAYWLRERPEVDAAGIAVYGGSYGGFMVLAALTTYPELWAAGVDIVGISNFVTFLENTSDYRRAHREAEYGSLERDRAFLESIAPINKIDQINAPLMVIHGANDPRVPLSEAEQLVAALEAQGTPARLLVFDDEGHGIVKLKNKKVAYPAVVAFLDEHVRSAPG